MKVYQKLDGGVMVSRHEYDIAADTAIEAGQLVKLSAGLVVSADAAETGAVLGIAAETHSGQADALDPRANGTKILVIDDPMAMLQCGAPQVTALASTATTLKVTELKAFSADDFNGGYVKLLSKAADSTNTDPIGKVRRVTDFALDAETPTMGILTLEDGGAACAGDVYALFPPIGFSKGNLNSAKTALVLSATAALPLRVVGFDRDFNDFYLIVKKHIFTGDA